MKTTLLTHLVLFCLLACTLHAQVKPLAGAQESVYNLVPNAKFDNPEDPLAGWTYTFGDNKHYINNYKFVTVVSNTAPTAGISATEPLRWVRLDGRDKKWTWEFGGIKIQSPIIRYNPKKRYKISVTARSLHADLVPELKDGLEQVTVQTSNGVALAMNPILPSDSPHWKSGKPTGGKNPTSRIYPIGYRWHPRAKKSNSPMLDDLREQVRFQPIYFDGKTVTGEMSKLQPQWKTISITIPNPDRTELQQRNIDDCVWLSVRFLVLDGGEFNTGYLDIADLRIEEIGDANEVKVVGGGATKGADGKAYTQTQPKLSDQTGPKTLRKDQHQQKNAVQKKSALQKK